MPQTAPPPPATDRQAVVICCDSGHLPFAAATFHSLARMTPHRGFDLILCTTDGITLPPVLDRLGVRLLHIEAPPGLAELKSTRLPANAYLRLWLPDRLLGQYDRLLYLDTDIFVQGGDLSALLAADLGPHPVGAVLERPLWGKPRYHAKDFKALNLPRAPYFNSGVLLIDVARWVEGDVLSRCLAVAERHQDKLHYHDQSLLNIALYEDWAELSPLWNWQWVGHRVLFEPLADPYILHLYGPNKPWHDPGGAIPARIKAEYRLFLSEHFPDAPADYGPERARLAPEAGLARLLWRHVRTARGLRRYLARFPGNLTAG
ncbi:glycosyltransferase family 8 protein [Pseudoroseicyclus tamaricis]|uniref:Glycosyltransferase family 8 protein n=1 Tax=Pseudoroseicyclus tamaricis TaxID=2705421 RepID=A0A6B2K289_9RHOB|nr:glycosyltransferase family 8 protein [Pseudoroseicyclus tamaricis]NDV02644.1 glycosyltransferase family 8 protein [Pseudoroseicyclus tamaricis]